MWPEALSESQVRRCHAVVEGVGYSIPQDMSVGGDTGNAPDRVLGFMMAVPSSRWTSGEGGSLVGIECRAIVVELEASSNLIKRAHAGEADI